MIIHTPFPKRLRSVTKNPVIDFYCKCMKQVFDSEDLDTINVCAFTINEKDYSKLKKLLKKYCKKNYPYLTYKRLIFEVNMILLDIGPRVNSRVNHGFVEIDKEILHGDT